MSLRAALEHLKQMIAERIGADVKAVEDAEHALHEKLVAEYEALVARIEAIERYPTLSMPPLQSAAPAAPTEQSAS